MIISFAFVFLTNACGGFFEEIPLEEDETTAADTESDSEEDDTEEMVLDCSQTLSACEDQDTLLRCQGNPVQSEAITCAALCGTSIPVTCYAQSNSSHGCWCAGVGKSKITGCADLEACIARCGGPELSPDCSDNCFARTTTPTARLLGALVYCAQSECEDFCLNNPAQCAVCRQNTLAGISGGCIELRAACDNDRPDPDFPTP